MPAGNDVFSGIYCPTFGIDIVGVVDGDGAGLLIGRGEACGLPLDDLLPFRLLITIGGLRCVWWTMPLVSFALEV